MINHDINGPLYALSPSNHAMERGSGCITENPSEDTAPFARLSVIGRCQTFNCIYL